LPGRERVVEVVVHTDGVDENGKLRHAPAEDERGDGKLVLEASPIQADVVSRGKMIKQQKSHPIRMKPATKKGIAI